MNLGYGGSAKRLAAKRLAAKRLAARSISGLRLATGGWGVSIEDSGWGLSNLLSNQAARPDGKRFTETAPAAGSTGPGIVRLGLLLGVCVFFYDTSEGPQPRQPMLCRAR